MNLANRPDRLLKGKRAPSPNHNGTSYTLDSMGTRDQHQWQKRFNSALEVLRCHDFDAIAFSGYSGCLIASMLAHALDKTMILVRKSAKEEGDSHSSYLCEGDFGAESYVIVDDFYCSGSTANHIIRSVMRDLGPHVRCIGQLQFHYPMGHLEPLSACVDKRLLKELEPYWNRTAIPLPPVPEVDVIRPLTVAEIQAKDKAYKPESDPAGVFDNRPASVPLPETSKATIAFFDYESVPKLQDIVLKWQASAMWPTLKTIKAEDSKI